MNYSFKNMLTNGQMAEKIGVDPKTLRKWARNGVVPCYRNPANGYRYYVWHQVMLALELRGVRFTAVLDRH